MIAPVRKPKVLFVEDEEMLRAAYARLFVSRLTRMIDGVPDR